MFDDYQIPAIALIAALMLAFAYLHLRFRSLRTLFWIVALACAEIQALLVALTPRFVTLASTHASSLIPWIGVVGELALLLSSALFLTSLSPLTFRIGQQRILFAV